MKKQEFLDLAIDAVENYLQILNISDDVTVDGYLERKDSDGKKHPILTLDSDDGILSKVADIYDDFKRSKTYDDKDIDSALRDADPAEFPGLAEAMVAAQRYEEQINNRPAEQDSDFEDDINENEEDIEDSFGAEISNPEVADFDFYEFCDYIQMHIKEYLSEEFSNATVSLNHRIGNNDVENIIIRIRKPGQTTIPNIYLNGYFESACENNATIDEICRMIARDRERVETEFSETNINNILNLETARDNILCKLVNKNNNSEYLSDKPTTDFVDLAVMYNIKINKEDIGVIGEPDGQYVVPITWPILNNLGITLEELHEIAIENLSNEPPRILSMKDQMRELGLPDYIIDEAPDEPKQFVISNQEKINGATRLLVPEDMEYVSEQFNNKDFIIIPASIHECIAAPIDDHLNHDVFDQMIKEVNDSELNPMEVLSDHLYAYDSIEKEVISISELKERRKNVEINHETTSTNTSLSDIEEDIPF